MPQQDDSATDQNLNSDASPDGIPEKQDESHVPRSAFSMKSRRVVIPVVSVAAILLLALGYAFAQNRGIGIGLKSDKGAAGQTKEREGSSWWKFDLIKPAFAKVEEVVSSIKPSVPFSKPAVSELENFESFAAEENTRFSDAQQQALEDRGFFLAENGVIQDQSGWASKDDFVDTYDVFDGSADKYYRKPTNAVFISSDYALHLYHLLVDRSFQRMEETRFQPILRAMTGALFLDSIDKYHSADDAKLKESYKRLSAYYLVPLVILDAGSASSGVGLKPEDYETFAQYLDAMDSYQIVNSEKDLIFSLVAEAYGNAALSSEVFQLASSELALIQSANGIASSPLFTPFRPEFINDYSQFKPRSHYTKNDILKSYFIAMMWYGRMGFTLSSEDLTRDALIITGQINNLKSGDWQVSDMWSDMSAVIDFFVGETDDLTAYQYAGLVNAVYGDAVSDQDFADDERLKTFISRAKAELPAPKIVSEALALFDDGNKRDQFLAEIKQFRFMGQRFTPDAYIINNLIQGVGAPDPETGQMLPTMPTALEPLSVIQPDNQIIRQYLDTWVNDPARIERQGRESDKVIAKVMKQLQDEFSGYGSGVWTQNIYWSWLNCFRPLLGGYTEGYPAFMQGDGWVKKNIGTVLGSFTELKHDTLLYAKQSYAELGGGGNTPDKLPPVVKGYVEPDVTFWNRIIALAQTTEQGLKDRNVFPEEFTFKYEAFIDSAKFFRQIAEQELQNQTISDEDFEKLRTINDELRRIAAPINGQELTQKEKRAGIIADIHTDAVFGQILYEATGKPFVIYVAIKDANGARLTRGAVFSHYEFTDTLDERLSDEDWQATVYSAAGTLPAGDAWSLELAQ